jgi:hypothetical protein
MLVGNTRVQWSYAGNNTTCTIKQGDEVVISKTVKRFAKDLPNKRLGRKVAFSKAMKLISEGEVLPKAERSAIWNAFRTNINQPVLNT